MRVDEVRLVELLTLESRGLDAFIGLAVAYPWGPRLYGGQVVAQGLVAGAMTVDETRRAHSLHAYFIRPGTHTEPVRFEVQRLRDGRSFSVRQVTALQSSGAILSMLISFQTPEDEADVPMASPIPDLLGPDDASMSDEGWGKMLERQTPPLDTGNPGHWIRVAADHAGELGGDPVLEAAALAFISDAAPTRPVRALHPDLRGDRTDLGQFTGASLDHSMWFHRDGEIAEWHWFGLRAHGLAGARGVATGDVFALDGTHRATLSQQVLLRRAT